METMAVEVYAWLKPTVIAPIDTESAAKSWNKPKTIWIYAKKKKFSPTTKSSKQFPSA